MSDDEAAPTIVTGSPVSSSGGPRTGEVLGERYELKERVGRNPFSIDYLAFDQESENQVLLRVADRSLLPEKDDPKRAAGKLQSAIGAGGKFLPGLLDADRDGHWLYIVEPIPQGTTLREVFGTRRARGEKLSSEDMLPVVARLAAALAAIPPPWRHGDVRAENVYITKDGLALTCPFLLAALPEGSIAATVLDSVLLSRVLAPEVLKGAAGDAADRYAVACIAYEGLTGRPPDAEQLRAPPALGRVGDGLIEMLHHDPTVRQTSLEPLITSLADHAGMPAPEIDPGAFRRARRFGRPRTQPPQAAKKPEKAKKSFTNTVEEEIKGSQTQPGRPPTDTVPEDRDSDVAVSTRRVASLGKDRADAVLGNKKPKAAAREEEYEDEAQTSQEVPSAFSKKTKKKDRATEIEDDYDDSLATKPSKVARKAIEGAAEDGTQELSMDAIIEERALREGTKRVAHRSPSDSEGTKRIPRSDTDPERKSPPGRKTGALKKAPSNKSEEAIDPRLLRAALGVTLEDVPDGGTPGSAASEDAKTGVKPQPKAPSKKAPSKKAPSKKPQSKKAPSKKAPSRKPVRKGTPDLDPRLVRAALGVTVDADASGANDKPKADGTEELDAVDLEEVERAVHRMDETPDLSDEVVLEETSGPAATAKPGPAAVPTPTAMPAAAATPSQAPEPKKSLAEVAPARAPAPKPLPREVPDLDRNLTPTGDSLYGDRTAVGQRPEESVGVSLTQRRKGAGRWILIAAFVVAAVIIAGGVIANSVIRNSERERRLQERFEQLQQQDVAP